VHGRNVNGVGGAGVGLHKSAGKKNTSWVMSRCIRKTKSKEKRYSMLNDDTATFGKVPVNSRPCVYVLMEKIFWDVVVTFSFTEPVVPGKK